MKRKRELEKVSEIRSAIEELSMMAKLKPGDNHDAAHIPTKPFLHVCNLVIQILDKIGPTMAVMRQDIHQNIQVIGKKSRRLLVEKLRHLDNQYSSVSWGQYSAAVNNQYSDFWMSF